jgi:probable O-glycosylation ligase (exosortase A-associated)
VRIFALFVVYYGSAGYALLNPLYGVLFFLHITIFRPENLVWESVIFGRLHLITAICAAVGYLIRRDGPDKYGRYQRLNVALFAAFVAWLWLISLTAAVSVDASIAKTSDLTKIFLFCLLLSRVISSAARIRLYVLVSAGSFGLLGLWGVLQGMAGNARLDSLWLGGSNFVAAILSLMIPFVLAAVFDRGFPSWQRIGLASSVIAMTMCLLYTDSRGGLLALMGGLLSLVLLGKQKGKLLVALVALALIVYPMIPSQYGVRLSTVVTDNNEEDLSADSRPILWQLALRMWQDHPVLGVGLGNFPLVVDSYSSKAGDLVKSAAMAELIFGRSREPHGLYTGLLAEAGLLGLALFVALLLRNAVHRFDSTTGDLVSIGKGAQAGILGFSVGAMFGDYQYIDVLYWQCFIIGSIMSSRQQEAQPNVESARLRVA